MGAVSLCFLPLIPRGRLLELSPRGHGLWNSVVRQNRGPAEEIKNSGAGLVISPGNEIELAEALQSILTNQEMALGMDLREDDWWKRI